MNFNIFWGDQKTEDFFVYEDFVDIFWGSSQNWTISRRHLYAFWGLSEYQETEWRISSWAAKFSNICLGA